MAYPSGLEKRELGLSQLTRVMVAVGEKMGAEEWEWRIRKYHGKFLVSTSPGLSHSWLLCRATQYGCAPFSLPRSNARRDVLWNWSKGSVLRHEFRARRKCPSVLGYRTEKDPRSASPKACGSPGSTIKICAQQVGSRYVEVIQSEIGNAGKQPER